MKIYNLHIECDSNDTYQKLSDLLGVIPTDNEDKSIWTYQLFEKENDRSINFSKIFSDLLTPNFKELQNLVISKNNILIWIVYEYYRQCALGFGADELQRLGKLNTPLNIDCLEINKPT